MPAVPYKVFMIYLPGNEASEYYREKTELSWKKKGYSVIPFEGTTPETLGDYINFSKKDTGRKNKPIREFTDTEKAIWYSNYRLWQMCVELDEPIIVIEHDSILIKDFTTDILQRVNCAVLSGRPKLEGFDNPHIRWSRQVGSGYFIRPVVAKLLLDLNRYRVDCNSDGHLMRCMLDSLPNKKTKKIHFSPHIRPYYNPSVGSTIDHKREGMKIVK